VALWYASREESNLTLEVLHEIVHWIRFAFKQQLSRHNQESGKRVYKQKLPNDREHILAALNPYKNDIAGIVVKSTYNWYWLVDLLMADG
jgi:hypothetical protein